MLNRVQVRERPTAAADAARRLTTEDFLKVCSAPVSEVYAYWKRKRGDRRMPNRAEIEPYEITRFLPGILLVDVRLEPLEFFYRLVGTREVEARGYDPTGRRVGDAYFGTSPEDVLQNYRRVVTSGSYLYDFDKFTSPGGRFVQDESLFLPLSTTGEGVGQILVYSHYEDLWLTAVTQTSDSSTKR